MKFAFNCFWVVIGIGMLSVYTHNLRMALEIVPLNFHKSIRPIYSRAIDFSS